MNQSTPLEAVLVDIQLKQTELAELQRQTQECNDEISRLLQTLLDVSEQHTSPAAIMHHFKEMAEMYIDGLTKQARQDIAKAPAPEQPQPLSASETSILPSTQSSSLQDSAESHEHQRSPKAEDVPSEFADIADQPNNNDAPIWVDFEHEFEEGTETAVRDDALEADMGEVAEGEVAEGEVAEDQAEAVNAGSESEESEESEEQGTTEETRVETEETRVENADAEENSLAEEEPAEAVTETTDQITVTSDSAGAASTVATSKHDGMQNAEAVPSRLSALKGQKKDVPRRSILTKLKIKSAGQH